MKILIVNDDCLTRRVIKETVKHYLKEATVVMAVDGQDGLRELRESRPNLVITDLKMETSDDGLLLAKIIKEESPTTPVIMISGTPPEDRSNIDCFVKKPFNIRELGKLIESYCH